MTISARLHILPESRAAGYPFAIVLATAEADATPEAFFRSLARPGLAARLTHDEGLHWTDEAGTLLLKTSLGRGGIILMGFRTLADAIGCRRKAMEVLA